MKKNIGLIETMYFSNGIIHLWDDHFERLEKGCRYFSLHIPFDKNSLYKALINQVEHSGFLMEACKLRLLFKDGQSQITVEKFGRTTNRPLSVGLSESFYILLKNSSEYKTTCRSVHEAAGAYARSRDYDDMLIFNENGNIVETTICNIFWKQKNDEFLYTPPLKEGCVAGVMRRNILRKNLCKERILTPTILENASEVYISNALRGLRAVTRINNKHYYSEATSISI